MPPKSKTSLLETSADSYIKNLKSFAQSSTSSNQIFSQEELSKFSLQIPVVISGGEPFRTRRIVSLTNEILFNSDKTKQVRTYFASELSNQNVINSLLADARGGSLFSKVSCVALYDTESLKVATIEKLLPIFALKQSAVFFVIVAGEKANKLLDALEGNYLTVTVPKLQGEQLAKWAVKELERLGHKGGIEQSALNTLVKSFGEDASRLATELTKLSLLVSSNTLIRESEVDTLLFDKPESNTFSLVESIAEKNVKKALQINSALSNQGMHPLQVLALLSKSLRSLSALTETSKEKLHSDISNPWILKNISKARRLLSKSDLTNSLALTARLDSNLKGSKRPPEELLQDLVLRIASRY